MKQLMDLAEQLDKYVSNFPYQVNVLSETHTFNYIIGEPEISLPHNDYDILVLMPGKYAVVIVNNVYGSELEYEKIVTSFKKTSMVL